MGHQPLWNWNPWWSCWWCVTPSPLWRNHPVWYGVLRSWNGHICSEGALRCSFSLSLMVLADSPMYPSSHSNLLHSTCILLHFFGWCCPCPWVPLGGFWWCGLPWMYTYHTTNVLDIFAETSGIGNNHMDVVVVVSVVVVAPEPEMGLCVAVFKAVPNSESIESPWGVFEPE